MSEHDTNPYAPPIAILSDEEQYANEGSFIPGGRKVPAGNASAWIGSAWEMFKQSPGTWIGLFLVFMLIYMVCAIIPLVNMVTVVLMPLLMGGVMIACERQRESGELALGDLFGGFQEHLGPLCIQGLLTMAFSMAVFIPIAIIGGIGVAIFAATGTGFGAAAIVGIVLLVLLALVAMLMLYAAMWFAPALIVLQGLTPFEAMKASFAGCMKNLVPGLIFFILSFLLMILGSIPLFLGLLVVFPLLYASIYTAYRDIFIEE
ncbi:hypothetical protein GCM10027046_38540 [Uliginosibacterium flavum]|uniref:BPSS1780 family membrane protein n=1 Tax=Uliginosibacterium flavum TaxID=1396831 RepID=A0ABV2TKU3_9RHOO